MLIMRMKYLLLGLLYPQFRERGSTPISPRQGTSSSYFLRRYDTEGVERVQTGDEYQIERTEDPQYLRWVVVVGLDWWIDSDGRILGRPGTIDHRSGLGWGGRDLGDYLCRPCGRAFQWHSQNTNDSVLRNFRFRNL